MSSEDANELLFRCTLRDANALQQLYKLSSPRMYAVAIKLLKSPELAEDVLQEAYIKIWNHAESFRPEKSTANTWMTTIVRNTALDKIRSMKRDPLKFRDEDALELPDFNGSPSDNTEHSNNLKRLLKCLDGLEQEQRDAVLLSFYHGYSHGELSEKLSKPLGTVKGWIRRGLERLRDCLKVGRAL